MKKTTFSRRAFSLMEILITIVIVAVLAALLLPTFWKSLGSARSAKCISNLRQAFLAYQAYASDHNGKFPESTSASNGVSPASEVSTIGSYATKYPPAVLLADKYLPNLDVFYCPAQKVYTHPDQSTAYGRAGWAKEGYYIGYTQFYLRNYMTDGSAGYSDYRNARVTDNPRVPILMDMTIDSNGTALKLHGDILNVVHLDGHVSQISSDKLLSISGWSLRIPYIVGQN